MSTRPSTTSHAAIAIAWTMYATNARPLAPSRPGARRTAPDRPARGCPLLHRDLEVVAHAHRQARARAPACAPRSAPRARAGRRTSARASSGLGAAGRRSSGHAPRGAGRARIPSSSRSSVRRREARLGRVGVDVDLEVDRQPCRRRSHARRRAASRSARSTESTDWMTSNSSIARGRPCCAWRWPTRCHSTPGRPGTLSRRLLDAVLAEAVRPGRGRAIRRSSGHGLARPRRG